MLNVGQLLLNNARNYPEKTAIISKKRSLSYYGLNQESNYIANALKKRGICKGDIVAILMKNSVEWCVAWFACLKLGAVFVPLHVRLRSEELLRVMELAKCNALIFGASFEEKAAEICRQYGDLRVVVCAGQCETNKVKHAIAWSTLVEEQDGKEAQVQIHNNDPGVLLFTSGTTGNPKGVMRTHEMLTLHGISLALRNNHGWSDDVMMSTAPLYHIGGLQGFLKMVVLGGTYITLERIDPEEVFHMIEIWGVTQLQMLPPVTYERLYKYDGWRQTNRSSVWEVCISAGKCTDAYIQHVFEMFPNCHLRPSWGSTETCSVTCMQLSQTEYRENPNLVNTVGTIMPLTEVRIIDEAGQDVTSGESGEAIVRSPMVFQGYIGHKEADDEDLFVDGEWFRTGDIMRIDPETGRYYFLDRKKDVIKTGGENVFALEIECAIQEHPAIQECAVVGVPDERFGEAIAAAVVLKPGKRITGTELAEFCKTKLPSFKKPRYMAVLDGLPVNDIGKTAKPVLREQAETLFEAIFE